jgi:DNA repair exonuclease SbcCD ATPase subunit
VNPTLSGSLTADHEALQNDLLQAQELAADFQRQLAGKSNEYAQLKQILEKTQKDLEHLQAGIVELRSERHRLANEAMRATAFEAKLQKVTGERDRLRIDLEIIRQALINKGEEMAAQLHDRDRHIAELVVEMVALRQVVEELRKGNGVTAGAPPASAPNSPALVAKTSVQLAATVLPPVPETEVPDIEIVRTAKSK